MPRAKAKQKLTPQQYAARFAAERARLQRHYCDTFGLWRDCALRRCRRDRTCRGEADHCLRRALATVPHAAQWQARQDVLGATPANIGAPERAARQCMPADFYAGAGDRGRVADAARVAENNERHGLAAPAPNRVRSPQGTG